LKVAFSFLAVPFRAPYQYDLNKDPGYNNKDILMIELGRDFKGYSSYINSIKSNPNVIMAGGVMEGLPMQGSMSSMYPHSQDKTLKVKVEGLAVDYNFVQTMGIKILEGREFSQDFGSDLKQSAMLNVAAVVVLFTVFFHSYKASRINPVDALRHE
jgi:putative ABC transport system permease protein